jgi:hypothetical protein
MNSKVLGVSSSGFYKWLKINPKIAAAKAVVKKQVTTIFKKSGNSYGSPRIALEMNKHGKHISKSTIGCMTQKEITSPWSLLNLGFGAKSWVMYAADYFWSFG